MIKKFIVIVLMIFLALNIVLAVPDVGTTGTDTTYGPSPWKVCRANESSAWVSADNGGIYNPVKVCNELGYAGYDLYGGTCGTVCGFCGTPDEYYDGNGLANATFLTYTVNWRCTEFQEDNGNGGEDGQNEVPEFSAIGAGIALAGAAGYTLFRRKK